MGKRWILAVVVLWGGCNAVNTGGGVTDQLRTACYWLNDEEIGALLGDVNEARDGGSSQGDLMGEAEALCATSGDVQGCNACFTLAIQETFN